MADEVDLCFVAHESFNMDLVRHNAAVKVRHRPIEIVSSQPVDDRFDWPQGSFV